MRSAPKNWALKISTLVVVTACFVVMVTALVLAQNFKDIITLWGDEVQMTVYLAPDISSAGKNFVERKLLESKKVAEVKFVDQKQALGDFQSQLASYAPDLARDEELLKLIPASLRVRLNSDVLPEEQTQAFKELAAEVRALEGVDDISYGQDWIEKYAAVVTTIEIVLNFVGLIIIAAALFVISNTIRASVQSRKEEIIVMEMVGATPFRIRRPFIFEGAGLGLLSSLLALGLSYSLFMSLTGVIEEKLSFFQLARHLHFMSPNIIGLFICGGTLLGALASYLCIRQLNDGFASIQGT